MDFHDRVKEGAKLIGKTVRDVVEESGENYDSYNSMRRYGNLPRADVVVKMAGILKTTVEYLVTGENPKDHATEKLSDVISHAEEILRIAKG